MEKLIQQRKNVEKQIIEVAEWANEEMFKSLFPEVKIRTNPFGEFGIDAATKLGTMEEWKFNNGLHDRLYNQGYSYLIEETKFDTLKQTSEEYCARPIMRKFFEDAMMQIDLSDITKEDLKQFYNGNFIMEKTQHCGSREQQPGFYVPYGYWRVVPYNHEQTMRYYKKKKKKDKKTEPLRKEYYRLDNEIQVLTAQRALTMLNFLHK